MIAENSQIQLSIITINYNLSKEIEVCLNSLISVTKNLDNLNYEIIIVDNNSPEKGLKEVENKFQKKNISFYYLEKNLGFGKGCNYGYAKASGKYICFLNPDTIITEDIFTPILKLFSKDESIGIIGPKQQTRKPFFDFSAGYFPNVFFEIFALLGMNIFVEGFIIYTLAKFTKKQKLNVNWILGACLFIKSDTFESINGFDEDYFMFFEELDLCKRVANKNYKILYVPNLSITHIGSVSGKKDYSLYTKRTYKSKFIFLSKNYKSFNKFVMQLLLKLQLYSQIIIWTVLFPLNPNKSKQKLKAFLSLIIGGIKK